MPKKGTARIKKVDKYAHESDEDISSNTSDYGNEALSNTKDVRTMKFIQIEVDMENVDPRVPPEQPKLSTEPQLKPAHRADQPRQDSGAGTVEQSISLAHTLFPGQNGSPATTPTTQSAPFAHSPPHEQRSHYRAVTKLNPTSRTQSQEITTPEAEPKTRSRVNRTSVHSSAQKPRENTVVHEPRDPGTMIQGGASIPANQQRNMRACMVCSIVRTQQQFLTQGCPNCEDIIELANNPDQINDCTSQVFEGLISVSDTSRSWVARYQRLEGYVPGVYATQVEGILPEDVLAAVENAGINYVPRDGSEQEMLGKD
ncbi:Spt4-domain-containing protein [Setomelanomma holmii]|uniref:Transcription elongation factor SPT4 n=1 Tax=Setomelanomma holmii TaxID=210430 RepID=A0A9P4LHI2_9PLEO|nr:Spt4-domain-containing protein [Setomelanomma holmii]